MRLTLHDGQLLTIPSSDVDRVYENLWRLAPRPDAVALAGVLVAERRGQVHRRYPLDLDEAQSAIIRAAVEMPDADV